MKLLISDSAQLSWLMLHRSAIALAASGSFPLAGITQATNVMCN